MRLATIEIDSRAVVVARAGTGPFVDLSRADPGLPHTLLEILRGGEAMLGRAGKAALEAPAAARVDMARAKWLPVIPQPPKIICVGLNYHDHAAESGFQPPTYPTIFGRFASSLIGNEAPIVRPRLSEQLDYECEFAAIIGRGGKNIQLGDALNHVVGYSLFNEASIRDYQHKAPQWTVGKNFDSTGAFGPELVTADELPPGLSGLTISTKLNGVTVQTGAADDMIFSVASLISILSEAITLEVGDVIVTGTPSGVGAARKPPLWMRHGDTVEVEAKGFGRLVNPVRDEVTG